LARLQRIELNSAAAKDLNMPELCRICLTDRPRISQKCSNGGEHTVINHAELNSLSTAHIDCDSFYASIEKRDNPKLIDKPVIVGGQKRGVVMAACYVARKYGIHSAMPMFRALRACPDAVVIPPDIKKYTAAGRAVREMMRNVTPLVEPISIDEAFLDLAGTERLHGVSPASTLARLAVDIRSKHGITVTVGLSHNKFLAKLASGLNKPYGFTVVGRKETVPFLSEQPVSGIWGVGQVMQKRLKRDGITLIGDLQKQESVELVHRYGEFGRHLHHLAFGRDDRKVSAGVRRKSLSTETTFANNISDVNHLNRILWQQVEKISKGVKKEEIGGKTVTLKLKTAKFAIRTRSRTLPHPTQLADVIFTAAAPLLKKEADGTAYRLLGVGLSEFTSSKHCDPIDLADPDLQKRKQIEFAIDDLRARFGCDAIRKGEPSTL
tara:strand:+ start:9328 stop:10638 length:1311 start_codon:yes stop_codon:yes gene_type:complete